MGRRKADEVFDPDSVESIWRHPQGAMITVFKDGTFICVNGQGRSKRTTATPELLRAGHGMWQRVGADDLPEPRQ
jgi:hypothetical protein